MKPATIWEAMQQLQAYHRQRREMYRHLAGRGSDERAALLLTHLVAIEDDALGILSAELEHMQPDQSVHLIPGPTLSDDPAHAMDCKCDSEPTFDEALGCALTSDDALDELIDRIAGSSAAESVQTLALRLREIERTKDREIAKFTRTD